MILIYIVQYAFLQGSIRPQGVRIEEHHDGNLAAEGRTDADRQLLVRDENVHVETTGFLHAVIARLRRGPDGDENFSARTNFLVVHFL